MEFLQINNHTAAVEEIVPIETVESPTSDLHFINGNTIAMPMEQIKLNHLIPVFIKDNEPVISQIDFIETVLDAVKKVFPGERILKPVVRVSHPVKGRIPEAKDKPAIELQEYEKTVYYERAAFIIELPDIADVINGNHVCLTVGGIKNYSSDSLYNRKGADEHFKVFIGFQNKVCLNLSLWSDGFIGDLKVKTRAQLFNASYSLFASYDAVTHLGAIKRFENYSLTEQQFAHVIGRSRMYQNLPVELKEHIPALSFGDNLIGTICRDYYKDNSFCRMENGDINLWNLYNLFTGANKSSYIDTFLDRSVNAYQFIDNIRIALDNQGTNWFLN